MHLGSDSNQAFNRPVHCNTVDNTSLTAGFNRIDSHHHMPCLPILLALSRLACNSVAAKMLTTVTQLNIMQMLRRRLTTMKPSNHTQSLRLQYYNTRPCSAHFHATVMQLSSRRLTTIQAFNPHTATSTSHHARNCYATFHCDPSTIVHHYASLQLQHYRTPCSTTSILAEQD